MRSLANRPRVFMMDLWATVPYYTAYLSKALMQAGVNVQIGSIDYYLDTECFQARGLRLDPGCSNLVGQHNLPRRVRRIAKLMEGVANLSALTLRFLFRRPDIVHVQFLPLLRSRVPADLWFLRFCRRRGAKLVLTVHDLLPHDTGERHLALYRELYAGMDALICHSAHIRARLSEEFGIPKAKIAVIAHGPFFYDLPQTGTRTSPPRMGAEIDEQVVLWQGILFPYKGVDLLLEAWQRVESLSEKAVLLVLGTGDAALLAALQQQAKLLGLTRVRFDFRFCSAEELVSAYRTASVVVYPYRAITTSGALATGLALGKAIVASDLPVFRELLTDGESALLVKPGDTEQLSQAIVRVLEEPVLRDTLTASVRAMQFGEQSWAQIAKETRAVYARTLGT